MRKLSVLVYLHYEILEKTLVFMLTMILLLSDTKNVSLISVHLFIRRKDKIHNITLNNITVSATNELTICKRYLLCAVIINKCNNTEMSTDKNIIESGQLLIFTFCLLVLIRVIDP